MRKTVEIIFISIPEIVILCSGYGEKDCAPRDDPEHDADGKTSHEASRDLIGYDCDLVVLQVSLPVRVTYPRKGMAPAPDDTSSFHQHKVKDRYMTRAENV